MHMNTELNQNNNEFKIMGLTMEKLSVFYGFFLIFWGAIISFISGSDSLTSYIPSFLGIPILIFAYLSIKFITKKKNVYAYCCSFWFNHFDRWA